MPDDSWADSSVHGLWKWGTYAIFDKRIVNLDAVFYLRQTSAKALSMAEKEKKDKYFQPGLKRRRTFTPMVYSTDGVPGTEAVSVQLCLSVLLSNKLEQ